MARTQKQPARVQATIVNSMTEFLYDAAKGNASVRPSWGANGMTLEQSIQYIRDGADVESREYRRTRDLIDKVDAGVHDRHMRAWISDVAGAYPVVPEYLTGMPEHMRRQQSIESEAAPVRIVVETLVSAGVSHESIVERGAALAALCMRMSEERPVELWVMYRCDPNRSGQSNVSTARVRLDSTPISLSQCVAVMTQTAFYRMVVFNHSERVHGIAPVGWAGDCGSKARDKDIRETLGLAVQDVVVQGGYLPDESMFRDDPVAWVNKQLEAQRHIDTEL